MGDIVMCENYFTEIKSKVGKEIRYWEMNNNTLKITAIHDEIVMDFKLHEPLNTMV